MKPNLQNLIIDKNSSLKKALESIELNQHGMIFVVDECKSVIGIATDGDIRRYLLNSGDLSDSILRCANINFFWERPSTPRELLLKRLDSHIRAVPLLDEFRRLVDIVTSSYMPLRSEGATYTRAKAPVRISFGGGGSDLTHYFASDNLGAVISATVSLYSHAALRIRSDSRVVIDSLDLASKLCEENLSVANIKHKGGKFGLILAVLSVINPSFGFELSLHSDFPLGSGLGGSAAVSAVILGCFNQFRQDQWSLHELSEMAYQAERHYLGVAGGWQDQYATVFGGFNFMEFRMEQNIVHPLRIPQNILLELEESLVLCDTGISHESGDIHQDQQEKMGAEHIRELVKRSVDLSYNIRNNLLKGHLLEFGQSLDKAWELKRNFSDKISSNYYDLVYSNAKVHGAVGGKLLGAGGGGFFLFFVSPFRKFELISYLQSVNLKIFPFRFEPDGLQSWSAREGANFYEGYQ